MTGILFNLKFTPKQLQKRIRDLYRLASFRGHCLALSFTLKRGDLFKKKSLPRFKTGLFLALFSNKTALVRKEGETFYVEHLETLDGKTWPLYLFSPYLAGREYEIVSGISGADLLVRHLSLHLRSKREAKAVLPFQLEHLLPCIREESLIIPTFSRDQGQIQVRLLVTSKQAIEGHLSHMEESRVDPDHISSAPNALFRFARHFFRDVPSLFVQSFSKGENLLIAIEKGKLVAMHTFHERDSQRFYLYMQNKYPQIDHMLSLGQEGFSSPFIPLPLSEEATLFADYAIPIGLAMDAASSDRESLQLRVEPKSSRARRRKQKRGMTLYFSLCGLSICSTLLLGQWQLANREQRIIESLGLSKELSLEESIDLMKRSAIESKKGNIPLPRSPKVSELLTWLSIHPSLATHCAITHFHYALTEPGPQKREWGAKVEIEMEVENGEIAKGVHQALLKDKGRIDRRYPVEWEGDQGIYRTTFFLLPKRCA